MKSATVLCLLLTACWSDGGSYDEPPPVARDDQFTIEEDSSLPMSRLAENDDNPDSYGRREVVDKPEHGTIESVLAGSTYVTAYKPFPGYHGPDRFTYQYSGYNVIDAQIATVTIDVTSDGVPYEHGTSLDTWAGNDVAVGDLDGDGRPDMVVSQADTIHVLLNRTSAQGAFEAVPLRFEGGRRPEAVVIADFDGDGYPDIATAAGVDGVVVLRNRGTANFELDAPLRLPAGDAVDLTIADFDRDGKPDVASLDNDSDSLVVRRNTSSPGSLSFGVSTLFDTPAAPTRIATGDADGVGGLDLIVISTYTGQLSLFLNAMAIGATVPAFSARIDRATGTSPTDVVLADLDADGRTEIGVLDDDQLWIYANRSVSAGGADFIAARVLELEYDGYRLFALDADATGPLDLFVGASYNFPSMLVNQSAGGGLFEFEESLMQVGDPSSNKRAQLGDTYGLASADLDGDGRLELIATGSTGTIVLFD